MARRPVLRRDRAQRRAGGGAARPRGVPALHPRRTAGRGRAAWSACTRRSRCRTRRFARPGGCAASWAPCCTSTWPRTAPTSRRARARLRRAARAADGAAARCRRVDPRARRAPVDRRGARAPRTPGAGSCRTRARTGRTASATRRRWPGPARVALGTDGFPSNMPDEAAALAETSAAAGEPPAAIAGRLDAGWELVAARLGVSRERLAAEAGAPRSAGDMAAIEDDARGQASRLWARW